MSVATVQILKESFDGGGKLRENVSYHFLGSTGQWNEERVQQKLNAMKDQLLAHQLGKGVRPWDLVNMSQKLDPKQPWVGIEFETGYGSKDAYQNIVNYVWDTFPLSAIDREGCGQYPCEITFSPVNFDDFIADTYHLDRLYRHMEQQKIAKSSNAGRQVGTHCNISTPVFRELAGKGNEYGLAQGSPIHQIVAVLNRSINQLSAENRKRFFGRNPYGLFYLRGNQYGRWLEGKLFNSTGSIKQWQVYKEVTAKFCEIVDHLATLGKNKKLPGTFLLKGKEYNQHPGYDYNGLGHVQPEQLIIANLAAVLSGKTPVKKLILRHV